ncbi:MAG: putative cytosol aminopeptidase [Pirellulaceae bacterium]|nr:MAG: putative cytosol aminopeptidase [Pirellulaceae bacterium]
MIVVVSCVEAVHGNSVSQVSTKYPYGVQQHNQSQSVMQVESRHGQPDMEREMVKIELVEGALAGQEADALVVTMGEVSREESGSLWSLPEDTIAWARQWIAAEGVKGKELELHICYRPPGIGARNLVVVGTGTQTDLDAKLAYRVAASAAKGLAVRPRDKVLYHLGPLDGDVAVAAVAGSRLGAVGQDLLRADKTLYAPQTIAWVGVAAEAVRRGQIHADAVALARELVNLPPNYLYPETFAYRAADVAVRCGLEVEVWDELRLRRENCNALLAVSAASARPPRLLVLKHRGASSRPPIALVGKGVTFDSGGLSLKPSTSMLTMKCDMAGAATVLATLQACAELNIDQPVFGFIGLVENMVSGASYKLGDVLTTRSGKTVEIHNTDAEGRLVLADVLDVALEYAPQKIVDIATLTGACVVALGTDVAGLMSNDAQWDSAVRAAADRAGELVWPLPMFREFDEQIRSPIADIKNVGEGRWGGAITAAKFLEQFVGKTPWTHLDIAGPAFLEKPKSYQDAGGSGVMVRSLIHLLENQG